MRARTFIVVLILAVIAVAGGWYFGFRSLPPEQTAVAGGQLMFPDFAARLADVSKIEISHQGKQTVIEKRPDGGWGVAALHDYPVQDAKLRAMLTGLSELRLSEPRTSDPTQFARLGVDDPNGAESTGNLLRILDNTDKPMLAVIVGHRRVRSQGNGAEDVYVRLPNDNQSWLAQGSLQADVDASLWLDRNIMNIAHDQIASVVAGHLQFARVDGKFALTAPADHPKLEDFKVEDVSRALELLTFQEVKAGPVGTEAGHAVFTTSDGLAVTVRLFHVDKDGGNKELWARFTASGPQETAKVEADSLNGRLGGWSYQIGSWKEKSLVPTIDDLKAEQPADADKK